MAFMVGGREPAGDGERTAGLLEAGIALAGMGVPVLPCHWPVPLRPDTDGWTRLGCSCGQDDCPRPARHLLDGMEIADATTDVVTVAQWWTGGLCDANVATVAGAAFGVVELRHSARPAQVRAWLAAFEAEPGPVLDAGLGLVQFLTSVGDRAPRYAPIGQGTGVRWLGHGELVALPPSRLTHRYEVSWLQGLLGVTLPDGGRLFEVLARLPAAREPAEWTQQRAEVR